VVPSSLGMRLFDEHQQPDQEKLGINTNSRRSETGKEEKMALLAPEDLAEVELSFDELVESGELDPREISMGTYTNNGGRRDKDG